MSINTVKELLTEARAVIDDLGWCNCNHAVDADNVQVSPYDPSAVGFSVDGAMFKVGALHNARPNFYVPFMDEARLLLMSFMGGESTGAWNDAPGRVKAEVLAVYDAAIAEAP